MEKKILSKLGIQSLILFFSLGYTLFAQEPKSEIPSPRMYQSMVYHSKLDKILLLGGLSVHGWNDDLRDVWSYDIKANIWKRLGKYLACPDSIGAATSAVYDSESNVVIVLNSEGETWSFKAETNEWKNMKPVNSPSARCGHMTTYDSNSDRIVLFGGFGGKSINDPPLDDTWTYDFNSNTWLKMQPLIKPPARMYAAMIFNNNAKKAIMWGGRQLEPLGDKSIWEYDFIKDSWGEIKYDEGPETPYAYPAMIYDDQNDEIIVFGGGVLEAPFVGKQTNIIWKYNFKLKNWAFYEIKDSPPPVTIHSMVLNPNLRKAVVFGGENYRMYSNILLQGTWILDLKKLKWKKM